ncbi:MAG: ABC transporter ATP-binding protein [Candidatus Lumbricidophila eiseniae]|uniref:ABC transporter ATP-binding protein n=1 Tax=Candidatus Lumbricidiphila eiseniae TaxID=1969409 RepID=A0A2A6FQU4_9MICO|nr:MAG: ABC transporter ATP-binding protein [Candidatus Lumbricidophila eiseniae]
MPKKTGASATKPAPATTTVADAKTASATPAARTKATTATRTKATTRPTTTRTKATTETAPSSTTTPSTPPVKATSPTGKPTPTRKPTAAAPVTPQSETVAPDATVPRVLRATGLVKHFGDTAAVGEVSFEVAAGSFFGLVGPHGAGKTITLSMITGLLRPDEGTVLINDIDLWQNPNAAKRMIGVLPDRVRIFDRLTGAQLLYYSGILRGLDKDTVSQRSDDLIHAFGLEDSVSRLIVDYSTGMTKKIALACAMIHSPQLLILDEPVESVDPVSAANLTDILKRYVAGGGTVVLSSHSMELIERVCDSVAIIVGGRVRAAGTLDEVRAGKTLEERFTEVAGGRKVAEGMEWLHSFSR